MVNMRGEKFDLLQPGKHLLLQVPMYAAQADTLLRVDALAERDGTACAEMYLKGINISGIWSEQQHWIDSPIWAYDANIPPAHSTGYRLPTTGWQHFGVLDLKVIWGKTGTGTKYLNILARHLHDVKEPVGGLLGFGDHTAESKANAFCQQIVELAAIDEDEDDGDLAARSTDVDTVIGEGEVGVYHL